MGPWGRVGLGSCRVDRGEVGWSSWRVQVGRLTSRSGGWVRWSDKARGTGALIRLSDLMTLEGLRTL